MGSDRHYPEEAPEHQVTVSAFQIDVTPVTNQQFRQFVAATGYVTVAEKVPDPRDYPGALPHMLKAGSLVFAPPKGAVDLRDWSQWWHFGPARIGAGLMEPNSPRLSAVILSSTSHCRMPKPTRPGREKSCRRKPSGNSPRVVGSTGPNMPGATSSRPTGGIWLTRGRAHFRTRIWLRTATGAPPRSRAFPPNGHGLFDMIGNVWEWTTDWFSAAHTAEAPTPCCVPQNPRGGTQASSLDPREPVRIPRKVVKGGSHLCAPNYCRRYRPAARHAQPIDTGMSHVGFRCVTRE